MRRTLGLTAAVVVAMAMTAFAQAKPDFSGTWTPVPAADASGGGGGGGGRMGGRGGGGPMTVKQTADSLSIDRSMRGNTVTTTYKLDGTESDITMGQMTAKASAKWDGDKLVITTTTDQGASTQTWSLSADGKLTIDRTGGRGPSSTTYTKGS